MSSKLDCPEVALTRYWSKINSFFEYKKILNIPLLFLNGKLVSEFNNKAELFNQQYAAQCTLV